MQTTVAVNISLPIRLKQQAEGLVSDGYYASFSDLTRSALRGLLGFSIYDTWAEEAKKEKRRGESTVMSIDADVDAYMNKICK